LTLSFVIHNSSFSIQNSMRIVVLGTGPFAVPMFQWLLNSSHEVPALITRPTPLAKGKEKPAPSPMRDAATASGLTVHTPASINIDEGKRLLAELAPELLVVCDYGQILAAEVLGIAPLGGINLHASLLPKYRGAAPIQWALLHGETETGVSVIHMSPRLDAGPILATRRTPIGHDETHPELEHRLAILGVAAVREAIDLLGKWDRVSPLGAQQDKTQATKAPRLKKEDGLVDWSRSAEQIRNHVRALKPWPGSFTFWQRHGQEPLRLVIDRVDVAGEGQGEAGTVLVSDGQRLIVAARDHAVSINSIQPAGKRVMSIADFLRGYPVRVGDRLGPGGVTTTSNTRPNP
jgi:methionyl-tRNA formyltransferase